jgi:hypothetical protein
MAEIFESDFPEIVICPICDGQTHRSQAVVYQLIAETFSYTDRFLFYCSGCHEKYNLHETITHMGNTYKRLQRRKK